MAFPWAPVVMGAGTILSQIWNSAEAARNRRFQERMSSTAHQREVGDLQRAGLNPMLSRMGSGASSPSGDRAQIEDLGRGVASALQVQQVKAQIDLTKAQAARETAQTQEINRASQEANSGSQWRLQGLRNASDLGDLSVKEREQLVPLALERARAEIAQISSSAEATRARAQLDQLDRFRAMNEAEFEQYIQTAGPAARFLAFLVRSLPVRPR